MRAGAAIVAAAVFVLMLTGRVPLARAGDMDGIMMQGGKMMMMKAGKPAGPMTSEMTMSDGTKVMMDGSMVRKDGTTAHMTDGQMMMMDGKLMEGGKAAPMAPR